MEENRSRVVVSLTEGRLEIEGPESFVEKQVERFASLIESGLGKPRQSLPAKPQQQQPGETPSRDDAALGSYENVFALAGDKIQILTDLPGTGKAEKTASAALLLTFANTLTGIDTTPFDAVRVVCEAHGCLDGPNFAKTLKGEKDAFVFGGTRNKQTLKLTVPGRRRAEQLAASLNQ